VIKKSLCTWFLYCNHQVHRDFSITLYIHKVKGTEHLGELSGSENEKDSHCTYNATMRRSGTTTVEVEKQKVLHILSVCLQP